MMKRCRKVSLRYSRSAQVRWKDAGKIHRDILRSNKIWKDNEKIHGINLGSSKADRKISQKTKANTEKIG